MGKPGVLFIARNIQLQYICLFFCIRGNVFSFFISYLMVFDALLSANLNAVVGNPEIMVLIGMIRTPRLNHQ